MVLIKIIKKLIKCTTNAGLLLLLYIYLSSNKNGIKLIKKEIDNAIIEKQKNYINYEKLSLNENAAKLFKQELINLQKEKRNCKLSICLLLSNNCLVKLLKLIYTRIKFSINLVKIFIYIYFILNI